MLSSFNRSVLSLLFALLFSSLGWAGDQIPKAAWKRPLGLPLANAGTNYSCFNGGPYSCQGSSKNDNVVETYRASVIGG